MSTSSPLWYGPGAGSGAAIADTAGEDESRTASARPPKVRIGNLLVRSPATAWRARGAAPSHQGPGPATTPFTADFVPLRSPVGSWAEANLRAGLTARIRT